MPNYKGHIAGGIGFYAAAMIAVYYYVGLPSAVLALQWFGSCLLGALFPDIDTKSKGQKLFYRGLFLICCTLAWQEKFAALVLLCFVALLPLVVRHRGLFHTWWFGPLLSGMSLVFTLSWSPTFFVPMLWYCLFFLLGVASHLWLDRGVKWMFTWS